MTDAQQQLGKRERIVAVATRLLREEGATAVTTRAVAQGAGVQAPAIYRLFGDKDGLLDAVAEQAVADFASGKQADVAIAVERGVDPVDDLHAGWGMQVEFGLDNPALFALMTARGRGAESPAGIAALEVLRTRVRRVAAAGRLRVAEERAVDMIRAAGAGAVIAILSQPEGRRDAGLADAMWDAVVAQILVDAPDRPVDAAVGAAIALRAQASELGGLSATERALLVDWLDRAIAAA